MIPGEYLLASDPIELNAGRATRTIEVSNRGDRPVQIGSHCHFFEVNRWLAFDRAAAYGMRLNVPAGAAGRVEPGGTRGGELRAPRGPPGGVGPHQILAGAPRHERVGPGAHPAAQGF